MTASFSQLAVYTGFQLNQPYIAASLCVNRNKPQLHCNGKCYLMRKLRQAEQKEKSRERENQRSLFQQDLAVERMSFGCFAVPLKRGNIAELSFGLPVFVPDIFQPPRA